MSHERLSIPSISIENAVSLTNSLFGKKILTEDDFKRPQYQKLRKFYTSLLIDQLAVPQELLAQPHFSSMATFEHPELQEESAILFTFILALQRLMFACGVEDFTISDLLAPKQKRSLHCISAVLNFIKFKNCQGEVYGKTMDEVESLEERRHRNLERNASLRQRIQQLRVQMAEEEVQIQQLMPAVEAITSNISELNREQAAETKEYQQLKTTNAEHASKKAELNVALAGQKEQCDNIKSKIVQSPERFKAEMARLESVLNSVKSCIDERTARFRELDSKKDGRLKYHENVQSAFKLIKCISTELQKECEALAKLEENQDKIRTQKGALKDITVKIQHGKRQAASKQDKASRMTRQHEIKISALLEHNQQLKRDESNYVEKNSEELMVNSKCIDKKMQEIIHMLEDKENQSEQEIVALQDAYRRLLDQVGLYHELLNQAWANISRAL